MRVFVAGATGTLGVPVVRELIRRGHDVTGTTRSEEKRSAVEELGATPVVVDALDRDALTQAIRDAAPEAVLHLLTALPRNGPMRPSDLDETNRVRSLGTENLLAAAAAAGARRFVAESFELVYMAAEGEPPYREDVPMNPDAVGAPAADGVKALLSLEQQVLDAARAGTIEGIVLRYAAFHGRDVPTSAYQANHVRRRTFPLLGGGGATHSWVEIEDAARATVDAMERGIPGAIYNVADDEPATIRDYFGEMARVLGAKPPRKVPMWLARLISPFGANYMAKLSLSLSNEKAKRELGWTPRNATYRDALRQMAA